MSKAPSVWLIRAGGHGEDEETALDKGLVIVGFRDAVDLRSYKTVADLTAALTAADEEAKTARAANRARQLWAFSRYAQEGDTVVLPLKSRVGQIALGTIVGPYEYVDVAGEKRHVRKVTWIKPDLPRSTFQQDLLYSFGAFLTVCRVQRNNAEERVAMVMSGKPDPGYIDADEDGATDDQAETASDVAAPIDLAQAAHDDIVAFVRQRFQGHDLARLVGAILEAEGYWVDVSPPGPDGGADILAGRGPLGLDAPTLCVQVKATQSSADVKIFRELVGTMDTFKADQGLLVCWGGFTRPLELEARQKIFRVRLWSQTEIVNAIYRTYERLSPELQAELPLKRVWMRVREETGVE